MSPALAPNFPMVLQCPLDEEQTPGCHSRPYLSSPLPPSAALGPLVSLKDLPLHQQTIYFHSTVPLHVLILLPGMSFPSLKLLFFTYSFNKYLRITYYVLDASEQDIKIRAIYTMYLLIECKIVLYSG